MRVEWSERFRPIPLLRDYYLEHLAADEASLRRYAIAAYSKLWPDELGPNAGALAIITPQSVQKNRRFIFGWKPLVNSNMAIHSMPHWGLKVIKMVGQKIHDLWSVHSRQDAYSSILRLERGRHLTHFNHT